MFKKKFVCIENGSFECVFLRKNGPRTLIPKGTRGSLDFQNCENVFYKTTSKRII